VEKKSMGSRHPIEGARVSPILQASSPQSSTISLVIQVTAASDFLLYRQPEVHCQGSSEVPMSTHKFQLALLLSAVLIPLAALSAQQTQPAPKATPSSYAAIPVEAAKQANPVKSSPESLARARKWWTLDCAMCHNASGDGKGSLAADMKLKIVDFTDANTLKDRTDGEIFYIIKNGHQDMPPEGNRVKPEENWDLVNYVRSLAKPK
jgi:mono/diheme cytochrome c family protein